MSFSIATWNINSVRLRLPLVQDFLKNYGPDILCLQEIKCQNDQYPQKGLDEIGYTHHAINGQKSYHGVSISARVPLKDIHIRPFCDMDDARHISALVETKFGTVRVHNFYIPAGGDEPNPKTNPKFKHKLDFLSELQDWFDAPQFDQGHILVGDFNIAPHENDVWSHKQLLKVVSHTPIETDTLNALQQRRDWVDLVRQHIDESERVYSWWSYRAKDWNVSDKGRRLDHIWATKDIAPKCTNTKIIREARGWGEKPSDHVPVITYF